MCYLVPRSGGAVTEIWAAVALGWRWSFTVRQPGLGIVTRVSKGGLKGGREGTKEGRKGGGGRGGGEQSSIGEKPMTGGGGKERPIARECSSAVCFCVRADDFFISNFFFTENPTGAGRTF